MPDKTTDIKTKRKNTLKSDSSNLIVNESSYLIKTRNSYTELTNKYSPIFKSFINNGSKIENLSKKEKQQLFMGIKDVTNYISEGFLYTLNVLKKGIDPREKILIAIYYKIINYKTKILRRNDNNIEYTYEESRNTIINSLNEMIRDKIEFAVFCALGIEDYHNRNFTWDYLKQKEYNFIYFTKHRVAAIILEEYLKNEVEALNETFHYKNYSNSKLISSKTLNDSNMEENIEQLSGAELIELSEAKWVIPEEYYDNIVDFLDGKIDEKDLLLGIKKTKKILAYIYKELKKKGYINDNHNENEIENI